MADTRSDTQGARTPGAGTGAQGGDAGVLNQAQSAMRSAADTASEMLDSAYDRGQRAYRQGSQAVGEFDATTLTGLLVAGAVGFALAWLVFGQSRYADDMVHRMSQSGRHREGGRMRRH
jgi:hypothetical protein